MRHLGRPALLATAFMLTLSACGDDSTAETTTTTTLDPGTTTTTTAPVVVTTTPTTTLPPGGPPLIAEGDKNETVAAFQWLLDCGSYGDITVDGNYGPATGTALTTALTALGFSVPDEDAFAALSRTCTATRPLILEDDELTVVGNAAPGDPELFLLPLEFDSSLTLNISPSDGILVTLQGPDGTVIEPGPATSPSTTTTTTSGATTTTTTAATTTTTVPAGAPGAMTWAIADAAEYLIVIAPDFEAVTFTLSIDVGADAVGVGDWHLTTTGIAYRGTKLALGAAADATITKIFEFLGHGVRGGTEFDTGWTAPGQEGIRGIAIEGFRFLFFGPNASLPSRPKTLVRVRVFASTTDADGNPRPALYVITPQGIGIGHTRAELLTVYPGLSAGNNGDEYYYRLTNTGGELCFYFGETAPTDASLIVEMSTECRS